MWLEAALENGWEDFRTPHLHPASWGPLGSAFLSTPDCALGEGPVPGSQQALYPLPSVLTGAHCILAVPLTAS